MKDDIKMKYGTKKMFVVKQHGNFYILYIGFDRKDCTANA
jgi:hypothetical protein